MHGSSGADGFGRIYEDRRFHVSVCENCQQPTIWLGESMIFPIASTADVASQDLPDDVRVDVEEARLIAALSPRGAAALLRLAIQKLCGHLGGDGRNLNTDIASLVAKGLPAGVQQALDTVRVIGNDAVHPGELDIRDDVATVTTLIRLVNFIAEKMITEPKEIEAIYGSLPESKRQAITKRDGGA